DIEPREVAGGEWTHCHSPVIQGLVDGFDTRALFHQELRLAPVRTEHAVADEPPAVAHEHAHFADLFRKLHARVDHVLAGLLAANDLEQPHDVRRTEEMRTDHGFRPGC